MEHLAKARKRHNKFRMSCIVPDCNGDLCGKIAIGSHGIQHNGILSLIADNGKVCFLSEATKDDEVFDYDIKVAGINSQASIFKCLCKEHDDQLFADIEKRPYEKEPKQNFQFALKALLYSFWEKCNDGKTAELYLKNNPIASTVIEDRVAYGKELDRFWNIMKSQSYDDLLTWVIEIPSIINCAASASINVERKLNGEFFGEENRENPLIHISLFPTDMDKSYILLSSLKENQSYFNAFCTQFTMLSLNAIMKRFNILLPLFTDHIMISPHVIQNMSAQQKEELLLVFRVETMGLYHKFGININAWSEQVSYYIF